MNSDNEQKARPRPADDTIKGDEGMGIPPLNVLGTSASCILLGLTWQNTGQPRSTYFLPVEGTMAFIAAWKAGSITKLFQRVIKAL